MSSSRLSWLETQLDREDLSSQLRAQYEAEADRLANGLTLIQQKQAARTQEELNKIADISALFQAKDVNTLVSKYGHEFIDDYEILVEGSDHVVYSSVSRESQSNRWICKDEEEAISKRNQLLYYRVYDHYMRDL